MQTLIEKTMSQGQSQSDRLSNPAIAKLNEYISVLIEWIQQLEGNDKKMFNDLCCRTGELIAFTDAWVTLFLTLTNCILDSQLLLHQRQLTLRFQNCIALFFGSSVTLLGVPSYIIKLTGVAKQMLDLYFPCSPLNANEASGKDIKKAKSGAQSLKTHQWLPHKSHLLFILKMQFVQHCICIDQIHCRLTSSFAVLYDGVLQKLIDLSVRDTANSPEPFRAGVSWAGDVVKMRQHQFEVCKNPSFSNRCPECKNL